MKSTSLQRMQIAALLAHAHVIMGNTPTHVILDEYSDLVIKPPPRLRDTRIAGSYDDNVQPRAPKVPDPERLSAADAKRARKAAKRLQEQQR